MNNSNSQQECIDCLDNNLQIIACAGAGKTRTIVKRIINILISGKAKHSEIVCITFTEKAAGELKQRIYEDYEAATGETVDLANMYIGTIHGFCLNILQKTIARYKKYTMLNEYQTKLFIKRHFNKRDTTVKSIPYISATNSKRSTPFNAYESKKINILLDTINFIREELINTNDLPSELSEFYNQYINKLHQLKFFDFTQIQYEFYNQLTNPDLINYIKSSIKYITIDEYQDTNTIQEKIIEKIVEISPSINVCVVGDDDQTIYHWRGSNISNFQSFPKKYNDVVIKNLDTNYRSSKGIVGLGSNVISYNNNRLEKSFLSNETYNFEQGDIIGQTDFQDQSNETDYIIKCIKKLKGSTIEKNGIEETINYDDMVILVHSPNKLKEFNPYLISKLEEENIPFIIEGTKQLFETPEINDMYNILVFFFNNFFHNDSVKPDMYDYKKPVYSPTTNLNDIVEYFSLTSDDLVRFDKLFNKYKLIMANNSFTDETIQDFYNEIILTLNIYTLYDKNNDIYNKVMYNLAAFSTLITDYETINFSDYLGYRFKGFMDFIKYDAQYLYSEGWLNPNFNDIKCLKIMSIHKSKGLEFPVVFMPFLCKNYLFPTKKSGGHSKWGILKASKTDFSSYKNRYEDQNESLRRLMYVGITRSKKYLFLTKSLEYKKPGGSKLYKKIPQPVTDALTYSGLSLNGNTFLTKELSYKDIQQLNESESLVFDFSTLKDMFECPHKFLLSSIFGFNSPLNVRMGYGRSLHNMLDDLHTTYMNTKRIKSEDELLDHLFLPLGHQLKQLMEMTTDSAKKTMGTYIKQYKNTFDYITHVEQNIDFKLNDMIFINGRIDLVRNNTSGEVSIIDFKSTDKAMPDTSKQKQLLIYALGYYKLTNEMPTAVISHNLRGDAQPYTVTEEKLEEINKDIITAYNNIKNNTFPKCKDESLCKHCNFYNSCYKQNTKE